MQLPVPLNARPGINEFDPVPATTSQSDGRLRITSAQLLGARGELKIEHAGEIYSLRRTRNGKLILTK